MTELFKSEEQNLNSTISKPRYAKKPWLAIVLTLIALGLGHLYVGKKKIFGWLMTFVSIISYYLMFVGPETNSFKPYQASTNNILFNISILLIILAFCFDAYEDAKTTKIWSNKWLGKILFLASVPGYLLSLCYHRYLAKTNRRFPPVC